MNRVKELQKDKEFEAWKTFKQVVEELKKYKFEEKQLYDHISVAYQIDKEKEK